MDTRPDPTLMGRILPSPIKNRVGYEFKKKTEAGPGRVQVFIKNPKPDPFMTRLPWNYKKPPLYIYIYSCNVNPISLTQPPLLIWSYFNFTPSAPHALSLTPQPHISSSQSHSLYLSSLIHYLTRPQAHKQSSIGSPSPISHCRHTVTSLQLSTLSTPFVLTVVDLTVAQPSAPLICPQSWPQSLTLPRSPFFFFFIF